MYKRAASAPIASQPFWHVGNGYSAFAGPLHRNAPHEHSVPVLLTGLHGSFRLQVAPDPRWIRCRTALIPAATTYAFDMAGEPLCVLYVEPSVARFASLAPLVPNASCDGRALVSDTPANAALRDLYENRERSELATSVLSELMTSVGAGNRRDLDPRVAQSLNQIQIDPGAWPSVEIVARSIGLSPSRFQHLFAGAVGVPFRRYRAWRRMLDAIDHVVAGASFTTAAHAAGYADQPHFAHHFRRIFGAPASPSLRQAQRSP